MYTNVALQPSLTFDFAIAVCSPDGAVLGVCVKDSHDLPQERVLQKRLLQCQRNQTVSQTFPSTGEGGVPYPILVSLHQTFAV